MTCQLVEPNGSIQTLGCPRVRLEVPASGRPRSKLGLTRPAGLVPRCFLSALQPRGGSVGISCDHPRQAPHELAVTSWEGPWCIPVPHRHAILVESSELSSSECENEGDGTGTDEKHDDTMTVETEAGNSSTLQSELPTKRKRCEDVGGLGPLTWVERIKAVLPVLDVSELSSSRPIRFHSGCSSTGCPVLALEAC